MNAAASRDDSLVAAGLEPQGTDDRPPDAIREQLTEAVHARPEPKPLDFPDREGWWAWVNDAAMFGLRYVTDEDIESGDFDEPLVWFGPIEEPSTDEPPLPIEELPPTAQDRMKRFVELELKKRTLEQDLKDTKARAAALMKHLVEDFTAAGTQSVRNGGLTLYLTRKHYVSKGKGIETQEVCEMLQSIGRGDLVKDGYNANSLKSWVLEQLTEREELERLIEQHAKDGTTVPVEIEDRLEGTRRLAPLLPLLNIGSNLVIGTRK